MLQLVELQKFLRERDDIRSEAMHALSCLLISAKVANIDLHVCQRDEHTFGYGGVLA